MKIGTKIRQIRDLKGFSQQVLAEEINVSQKQLSRYESDETSPTLETVEKICKALEIGVHDLLEFDGGKIFSNNNYNQQGGEYIAVKYNEAEQIAAIYEKVVSAKNETIESLKHEIEIMKALKTD